MATPLRIALLGCGMIARTTHLPAYESLGREVADITVFASGSLLSAQTAAAEWGRGEVVGDWREALTRADVDAVDICAPNWMHAEMAVRAAEAGKHVIVEKPMATTLADADAMIAAADGAGVLLMPAHNLRFARACRAAALIMANGEIGDVVGIRASLGHAGPETWAPEADWFFDREHSGGGALMDLGVHLVDLIRAVTAEEFATVTAIMKARPGVEGIENAAEVGFRLRNGAIGSLRASWDTIPPSGMELTVIGSEGTLVIGAGSGSVRDRDGNTRVVPLSAQINPYGLFVEACTARAVLPVSGIDGRAALAVVLAAYESARTQTTVVI